MSKEKMESVDDVADTKRTQRLTDAIVKGLPAPEKGNRITYDSDVKGFGIRVTAKGARAFILNYRTRTGRERRFTIGSFPDWKVGPARQEAKNLKQGIDRGIDPLEEIEVDRDAKTIGDLVDRFETDHLRVKVRPKTAVNYRILIRNEILPAMKRLKVADVTFSDVDDLHRKISRRAPYQANRTVAVLSKMFALSIRWGWRTDNPAKGIQRNQEVKRHRYLSAAELGRLTKALSELDDQQAANILRLLLLTGARRGEVQAAKWEQFDLTEGIWTKPGSTTKQKTEHRVPLSAPARVLLSDVRAAAEQAARKSGKPVSPYVFPGAAGGYRVDIKKAWNRVCVAAEMTATETITGRDGEARTVLKPSARMHDLRHTYASVLASAGMSLPVIGALLGHSQPATTARYAHLMDEPLKQATERAAAVITGSGQGGEVVKLGRR